MIFYNTFIFNKIVVSLAIVVNLVNVGRCEEAFLKINGDQVTIGNDLFAYTLNENASAVSLIKNGRNLLTSVKDRTFYFDWNAGGGKFLPTNFSVVTNTSDIVHLKYFQPNGPKHLQMEYHIAVLKNVSGFYQWIKVANTGSETLKISEFRMVYRLSKGLMPGMSNGVRRGSTPKGLSASPTIQDTTWQLKDGSYFSKYDYSGYIRETPWFGIFGGGVGSWVVSPSREYHSGGPLKQDLLTQHYSIMCHYLTSCHYGGPFFIVKPGFSKFYGPWLLYVNSGSDDEMLEDVARQAEKEMSLWPYNWVGDPDYPIERGVIQGRVDGEKRATVVVYDSVSEKFDVQTQGYLYNTETDENGRFVLSNVRPGNYTLVLYPVAGHGSDSLVMKNITVVTVFGDSVFLKTDGLKAIIGNGLFNVTFEENAQVSSLYKKGHNQNLVSTTEKTFYLDWSGGVGTFVVNNMTVIKNTSEIAHIMYYQQENDLELLRIENHFVVKKDVSGFYQFVKVSNPTNTTRGFSELRTVHRFNRLSMPHLHNGHYWGDVPDITDRPLIQDTTWQLSDGAYWSKYDFCDYIRDTPWFGVFGNNYGAWVISASREYHSGGPLKQDLLVHHGSLSANYLTSSHYGTPNHEALPGWSKLYGPWLMYINAADNFETLFNDAAKQAETEKQTWPYNWVDHPDYPIKRGSLAGRVDGQKDAAVVLYDSVEEQFDLQTKGYLYETKTDENGNFNLSSIRPGEYRLIVYPLAGHSSEVIVDRNVTIKEGTQEVETLYLPVLTNILWNIGETNRRSDSFRYSDEPRNFYWHTLPPTNLTYVIGKSNPAKDWYYAQTHNGTWEIVFDDKPDGKPRILRVALAAASGSLIFNVQLVKLTVSVNGHLIGNFTYENDKAIYRDALQSGNFFAEKMMVDPAKVLDGRNVVSLTIVDGMVMYDAISYQIGNSTL